MSKKRQTAGRDQKESRIRENKPFSLLIKPASADCNLACSYCFYLQKSALYADNPRHRMSEQLLEQLIKSYMATEQEVYSFGWQGGEPTLMGLDFFKRVVALQRRYGRAHIPVTNVLQTNATLIDESFARFLARHNFLVGCSLDGPSELHDQYRRTRGGGPSHDTVLSGIKTLQNSGVEVNVLVLVNQANVHRAAEVYRHLLENDLHFQQYIPCVEFDAQGKSQPWAVSGPEWGEFMCSIFDLWYEHDRDRVSIGYFDSLLEKMVTGRANICSLADNCCNYFVVEHNGDVYPCDFFVDPAVKLGNVSSEGWGELAASPAYRQFGECKAACNVRCGSCTYYAFCMGDCLKHRSFAIPPAAGSRELSVLCSGWKQILDHGLAKLEKVADEIQVKQRWLGDLHQVQDKKMDRAMSKPGRNQPCSCGSGLKYKRCCGR